MYIPAAGPSLNTPHIAAESQGKRNLLQMLSCYFILLLYIIYDNYRYNLKTIET